MKHDYWLLALFCLPLFVALDASSIWDANEAFYVQTPREMMEAGEWVVPYFNGAPRLNKPPLSYWIVLSLYKVFGVSILAERVAMAVLACGSVLCLWGIGRVLLNPAAALWGAGIFAATFRFMVLSRRLLIDVLVLFCLLAALFFFVRWLQSSSKRGFLGFCALMGLGFLAKGPVVLLPLLALAPFLFLTGRHKQLGEAPWLAGGLLFTAISASWFLLLAWSQGWGPVVGFFLEENLGRFSHIDFGPQRGYFYYVAVFLTEFAPWSFLFPFAALWAWRSRAQSRDRSAFLLLALWIAAYFLVFSFSHNKQEYYILPLYPAAALIVAAYLQRGMSWPARVLGAVPAVLAAAAFGILAWAILSGWERAQGFLPPLLLVIVGASLAAGRWRAAVVAMSLFYTTAFLAYLPPLERYKPVRPLCRTIERNARGQPILDYQAGYYRLTSPSMAYYLGHPILELYDPEEAVGHFGKDKPVYLIMQAGDYQTLSGMSPVELEIVEVRPKLYTTARNLSRILHSGRGDPSAWTRPVYLVTNRRGN